MADAEELRAHVDAAYQAADRLVREATERAQAAAREVPPSGWHPPGGGEGEAPREPLGLAELQALAALLASARGAIPPEILEQLARALRELLLALRALIDWWVARLERAAAAPVEVEDIPIV